MTTRSAFEQLLCQYKQEIFLGMHVFQERNHKDIAVVLLTTCNFIMRAHDTMGLWLGYNSTPTFNDPVLDTLMQKLNGLHQPISESEGEQLLEQLRLVYCSLAGSDDFSVLFASSAINAVRAIVQKKIHPLRKALQSISHAKSVLQTGWSKAADEALTVFEENVRVDFHLN